MPGIHPGLQQIVYCALAKDVSARYQQMNQMLADLKRVRSQLPVEPEMAPSGDLTRPIGEARAGLSKRPADLRKAQQRASEPAVPLEHLRRMRTKVRRFAYLLAALALLSAALLFVPVVRDWVAGLFSPWQKHIAVLPFENVSGDPGDALLVSGLNKSLADRLSNLDAGGRSLWVVPGSEVQRLQISDPADALKRLGTTLVVRGAVNKHGQYVQLTVNLIDSKRLRQIGSVEVEDADGNIASLETKAVGKLARLMNLKLSEAAENPSPSAPAAYESYLKAVGYMERYDKAGNVDSAIAALQKSIAIDPKFAVSYALLGEAYRTKSALSKDPKWPIEAEINARKALELNPDIASACVTLGHLQTDRQPELAMQEFQHALAIDSLNARAVSGIARIYEQTGRLAEAESAFKKALALQPEDWNGYEELGNFYDRNGRYKEALAVLENARQLTPDNAHVLENIAVVEMNADDPRLLPDAERLLKMSLALGPSYQAYASLAVFYQKSGRTAEAAATTEKALAIDGRDEVVWANLVNCYELLGKKDKADEARHNATVAAEHAIKIDPRNANAHALLADEYAHGGRREQALSQIETAEVLAPNDPAILSDIADAFEGMGERKKALAAIDKAMHKGLTLDELNGDPEAKALAAAIEHKH